MCLAQGNVSCSRTQHDDACGDRTQDLSIRSLTLYHYATTLPDQLDTLFMGKLFLEKLKGYGIRDNILMWIQDFLSNRKQRVSINGRNSEWRNVTSGIPQGSVLGPILFLIYINDLPSVVRCLIKLFADDAKLYQIIRRNQDRVELQGDISNSKDWSIIWKMFFNIKKCKHMHVGPETEERN